MLGQEPDEKWVERHADSLSESLDVYEKILSKQKYLAGDVCHAIRHDQLKRK